MHASHHPEGGAAYLGAPPMPPTPYLGNFDISYIFGPKMGSRRPGRYLKSFLEAVRFIVTHYGPVGSHGDPIHGRDYGFGTQHMCCVESPDICCVETQDMCCVETPDMCCVERPDMCCLERHVLSWETRHVLSWETRHVLSW